MRKKQGSGVRCQPPLASLARILGGMPDARCQLSGHSKFKIQNSKFFIAFSLLAIGYWLLAVPVPAHASKHFTSLVEEKQFYAAFEKTYSAHGKKFEQVVSWYNGKLTISQVREMTRSIFFYSMYFSRGSSYPMTPSLVVAVIAVESNFNPNAVSKKGASGLGQLMPGTANGMGIGKYLFHPVINVYGTVRYLRGLFDRFAYLGHPYQYYYAIASYNAGPGAVQKYGGVPPYKETQNYVRKVTQIYSYLYANLGM